MHIQLQILAVADKQFHTMYLNNHHSIVQLVLLQFLLNLQTLLFHKILNKQKRFSYGYGVFGIFIILPSPFLEGSIHLSSIDFRGNLCYNLGYLDV